MWYFNPSSFKNITRVCFLKKICQFKLSLELTCWICEKWYNSVLKFNRNKLFYSSAARQNLQWVGFNNITCLFNSSMQLYSLSMMVKCQLLSVFLHLCLRNCQSDSNNLVLRRIGLELCELLICDIPCYVSHIAGTACKAYGCLYMFNNVFYYQYVSICQSDCDHGV